MTTYIDGCIYEDGKCKFCHKPKGWRKREKYHGALPCPGRTVQGDADAGNTVQSRKPTTLTAN